MTAAYAPEAYVFGSPENHDLLEAESNELLHFGHRFPAPNGGSTWLDDRGNPDPSHGIQTWITCRMAHVYTLGAIHGEPDAEELVDKALDGLRGPLHDDVNGGWYPSITADGTPEAGKVCYTHAFVILAATSATLIGRPGAKELLSEALDTYNARFWDEEHGLAVNTSAVLATVTDKQEYKDWYATFWRYIDEYLIDHEHGSWFHQLDKDNHVIGTVWPGKSDLYHALQCTFIPRLNPAVSVAPALKQATETR